MCKMRLCESFDQHCLQMCDKCSKTIIEASERGEVYIVKHTAKGFSEFALMSAVHTSQLRCLCAQKSINFCHSLLLLNLIKETISGLEKSVCQSNMSAGSQTRPNCSKLPLKSRPQQEKCDSPQHMW